MTISQSQMSLHFWPGRGGGGEGVGGGGGVDNSVVPLSA